MNQVERIDEILVNLFNVVLKMEEKALNGSGKHNLSMTEMHTLAAIGGEHMAVGSAERSKTMSQVAAILKISVSTLTTAVSHLVKKGYVERFRTPEDKRIVKVRLTQAGRAAVAEHEEYHAKLINEAVSMLSPEEIDTFVRSLESINEFVSMQRIPPVRDVNDYKLAPLRIRDIVIPVPIFQGGMGVGVSLGGLAGEVAREGGVGCVAATECGYGDPEYAKRPVRSNLRALKAEVQKALRISAVGTPGPVAVNIPYTMDHYSEYVEAAIEAGARIIISGAGIPTSLPGIVGDRHIALIPIISSPRGARVIIKNWQKKHGRTPDAFIFEGPYAGGTLGYKTEKIDRAREDFYANLVEVKEEISQLGNCPLIVGGGIYTRDDAKKAFAYGADGIQIGTRFVTTEECDADEAFKQAYIAAGESDIALVAVPGEKPCWAIRNDYVRSLENGGTPLSVTEAALRTARGDMDNGLILCGRNCWKANKIEKVSDIFRDFI
ncbi:MAG: nitronate monooxygenase [Eubacteriaceae bacterium]|jgi:NAD(P)H-dependent flavin oxidoreductase YrpB (nitropropane dioxygenase family)/DNA-binding MarR family transcriptional regulator|nr:nitronate monooxygenase [Eubacteriaceae bacterium]